MTTYAVTGATGKLGRLVLDELLAKTEPGNIVALARNPGALADYAEKGVHVREADYDDPASLEDALRDVEQICARENVLESGQIAEVIPSRIDTEKRDADAARRHRRTQLGKCFVVPSQGMKENRGAAPLGANRFDH